MRQRGDSTSFFENCDEVVEASLASLVELMRRGSPSAWTEAEAFRRIEARIGAEFLSARWAVSFLNEFIVSRYDETACSSELVETTIGILRS